MLLATHMAIPINADSITDGLTGHWKLDGDATDSSGNNHNATEVGTPEWTTGLIGQAVDMEGSDELVVSTDVQMGTSFSVSTWLYPHASGMTARPFVKADVGESVATDSKEILINSGQFVFRYEHSGGSNYDLASGHVLQPNQWVHLVVVRDDATGNAYTYVNGTLTQQATSSPTPSINSAPTYIGSWSGTVFDGLIDDVRVYNRALSGSEITLLFDNVPEEADIEGDGLSKSLESILGSDPLLADTDSDGLDDKKEVDLWLDPTVDEGLHAIWSFDNLDGTTFSKEGPASDGDLTIINPTGLNHEAGLRQNALRVNVGTDYLEGAYTQPSNSTFSVSVWINTDTAGVDQKVAGNYKTAGGGWLIGINNNQLLLEATDGSSGFSVNPTSPTIPTDQWVHLAFTYNAGGNMVAYIDGVLVGQTAVPALGASVNPMRVGAAAYDPSFHHFNGLIDDLRVYDKTLSQAEITALAANPQPPVALSSTVVAVAEDPTTVTLAATDANGDSIIYQISSNPANGTLTQDNATTYNYTSNPGYEGTDKLEYIAHDNTGLTFGTITLEVLLPPAVIDGEVSTPENQPVLITLPVVNPDNVAIYHKITSIPLKGTLYQTADGVNLGDPITRAGANLENADGKLFFVPGTEESGQDYADFSYQVIPGADPVAAIPEADKSPEPDFPTGGGTIENPYKLANLPQLISFQLSGNKAKHYQLTANIDAGAYDWNAIPNFSGTFDGNGFNIYNLNIVDGSFIQNLEGADNANHAAIKNLGLVDVNATGDGGVAPLVFAMRGNSEVQNCFVTGNVTGNNTHVSGMVGFTYATSGQDNPLIKNSWSAANVVNNSAFEHNGGLVGEHEFGTITDCFFGGTVNASHENTGGIAGTSAAGVITKTYSFGFIVDNGGGIVGKGGANTTNSFWDSTTANTSAAGDAKTSAEMKDPATYIAAGWEFDTDTDGDSTFWETNNALNCGYPHFNYQNTYFVCNHGHMTIHVTVFNDPPVFTSNPPATATEEQPFVYTLSAEDPEGDTFSYSGTTLPSWLSIQSNQGTFTLEGTPGDADIGTNSVTIKVQDTGGGFTEQSFDLHVIDINDLPVTTDSTFTVDEDVPTLVTFSASDVDGDPLTYLITQLPTNGTLYQTPDGEILGDPITSPNTLVSNIHGDLFFVTGSNDNGANYTTFKFQALDGATPNTNTATDVAVYATPPSGDGTISNPYQISILGHLSWLAQNPAAWSSYFIQTADIDAYSTVHWDDLDENGDGDLYNDPGDINNTGVNEGFPPIGSHYTTIFTGFYDGRGNRIFGLTINRPERSVIGMFGKIENASVANIGLEAANITGNANVGALVGILVTSTVENSYSTGTVTGATVGTYSENIGGLVGQIDGVETSAAVKYSWSGATVTNPVTNGGGLVGYAYRNSSITHSFARGTVTGAGENNGGLVGLHTGTLHQVYSLTSVTATGTGTGGLVGSSSGTATEAYWNTETSGLSSSAIGDPSNTADMQNVEQYGGWDFTDPADGTPFWKISSIAHDGYPYLSWQKVVSISNESTLTVNANPVPDPPDINAVGSVAIEEDSSTTITLSASDPEGDSFTFSATTSDPNVSAIVAGNSLALVPVANWFGIVDVFVTATDAGNASSLEVFTFSVNPINDIPVPVDSVATTDEDSPVAITLQASDLESDTISYFITQLPTNGSLFQTADGTTPGTEITAPDTQVTNASGTVLYSPVPDSNGVALDTIDFQVTDPGTPTQVTGQDLSIAHQPTTSQPFGVAYHDGIAYVTVESDNTVKAIDTSDGSIQTVIDASLGQMTIRQVAVGPNGDLFVFYGTNEPIHKFSLPYDQNNPVSIGTVHSAHAQQAVVDHSGTYLYIIDATNNITRIKTDGSEAAATIWTTVSAAPNLHGLGIAPNGDLYASALFADIYHIPNNDGTAGTPTVFASSLNPYGLASDAVGNLYVATHDQAKIHIVDPAAQVTTFTPTGLSTPHHIAASPDGSTIIVTDWDISKTIVLSNPNTQALHTATVTIDVNPVPDAPVLDPVGNHNTAEDTPLALSLSGSDADGDNLLFVATSSANIHAATAASTLTLTPAPDWHGSEVITITVDDGTGLTDTETITVTVEPVDDVPTIVGATPANGDEETIIPLATPAQVTTIAGDGTSAFADGTGAAAQFNHPTGIVVDSNGDIFISDYVNHRIRKMNPAGVVTTFVGSGTAGSADGTGTSATFNRPSMMDIDSSDNLYVADGVGNTIRKITPAGIVTTIASTGGSGTVDGNATTAKFNGPNGIAYDEPNNFLYVAGYGSHTIRKINLNLADTDSNFVTTFAGAAGASGHVDDTGAAARFRHPWGLDVDSAGNVYVAEYGNRRVRKITQAGEVTTIAGDGNDGTQEGFGTAARFNSPWHVLVLDDFTLLVGDNNHRILEIDLANNNLVTTVAGDTTNTSVDGPIEVATVSSPSALWGVDGSLYFTSYNTHVVRKLSFGQSLEVIDVDGDTMTANLAVTNGVLDITLAGAATISAGADESAALSIQGTATDVNATLKTLQYIPDDDFSGAPNLTYSVSDGNTTTSDATLAITVNNINDVPVFTDPGNQTTAEDTPLGISLSATDADGDSLTYTLAVNSGNVVTAVSGSDVSMTPDPHWNGTANLTATVDDGAGGVVSHTFDLVVTAVDDPSTIGGVVALEGTEETAIPLVSSAGVSTLAGDGTEGYVDGPGASARFDNLYGIASDADGNLYVGDQDNHRIRKITPDGQVSTFAGDGTTSVLNAPRGVTVDLAGNVYAAGAGARKIWKIKPDGTVSELAGSGANGTADGSATAASFKLPYDIEYDATNNFLYVADNNSFKLRKIDLNLPSSDSNFVTSLAGSGTQAFVDGTGAGASFHGMMSLAVDSVGNVYLHDGSGYHIRKVTPAGVVTTIAGDGVQGYLDGTGTSARIDKCRGLELLDDNTLLMTSDSNHIRVIDLANNNEVTTLFGDGSETSTDGSLDSATTAKPIGITSHAGNLFIVSKVSANIRKVSLVGGNLVATDVDGDTLTASLAVDNGTLSATLSGDATISAGANNSATLSIQGDLADVNTTLASIQYTGNLDFFGNDTLTYSITDAVATTQDATASITVTNVQDPPVLDAIGNQATDEDTPIVLNLTASDVDEDSLTFVAVTNSGDVTPTVSGTQLTLTPDLNWNGTANITISVDDGNGNIVPEAIDLVVTPVNDVPVSADATLTAIEDTPLALPAGSFPYTDVESSPMAQIRFQAASQGLLHINHVEGGIIPVENGDILEAAELADLYFLPDPDENGTGYATIQFEVHDGTEYASAPSTLTIDVTAVNDAPVFGTIEDLTTTEDTPTNVTLAATDVEEDSLTFSATGSANIAAVVSGTTLTLTPALNFTGTETIHVTADDSNGGTDTGSFTVSVNPVNDAPTISGAATASGNEDAPISFGSGETVARAAGDGTVGHVDGPALSAKLSYPNGMAIDSQGNIFIAEFIPGRIRKIDPDGNVTTFAGGSSEGHVDGTGTAARFTSPYMMAADNADNLYITDTNSHVIRKITPAGVVSTLAGSPGISSIPVDGTGGNARFSSPIGMAYDAVSNFIYVADYGTHAIRKINLDTSETDPNFVTTLAGSTSGVAGGTDDTGSAATFQNPHDLAVDSAGNVYVSESVGRIRKITPAGVVTTIAGDSSSAFQDGTGLAAKMRPTGLAMLDDTTLAFFDGNNYIRVVELDNNNEVKTLFGNGSTSIIHGDFSTANVAGVNNIEVFQGDLFLPETTSHSVQVATFGTSLLAFDPDGDSLTTNLTVDNGTLSVTLEGGATITEGANGSAALAITASQVDLNDTLASLQYTGNADFFGTDTLTYSVGDGTVTSAPQTMTIAVANVQDEPVVTNPGPHTLPEDHQLIVAIQATDPDEDSLSYSATVNSGNATSSVTGDAITVTPEQDWNGTVNITASVDDGNGNVVSVTFDFILTPVNDEPTSANGTVTAAEDTPRPFSSEDFTYNDVEEDPFTTVRLFPVSTGTLWFDENDNGILDGEETEAEVHTIVATNELAKLKYLAPANASGEGLATFVFEVGDGIKHSALTYTMTIDVTAVNDAPTLASIPDPSTPEDTPLNITLEAEDVEEDSLNFSVTPSANITATLSGTTLTLTPAPEFHGTEAISVSVEDGNGGTDSSTFNVTVSSINDIPAISGPASLAGTEETPIAIATAPGISTLAGIPGANGFADGNGTSAQFSGPIAITNDDEGNLYVADSGNNRIRKITPEGVVTTLAGDGTGATLDENGTSAQLHQPYGMDFDNAGNLYFAQTLPHVVRKIDPSGNVTTIAGSVNTQGSANGSATDARFNFPKALAYDRASNFIYVLDTVPVAIRKIDLNVPPTDPNFVTLHAGGVDGYADGTGAAAQFAGTHDLDIDNLGNLYVADTNNHRIRKVTPQGVVTTIAGNGTAGLVDAQGTSAQMTQPFGIHWSMDNLLYFSDNANYLRAVDLANNNEVVTIVGDGSGSSVDGDLESATYHGGYGITSFGNTVYATAYFNQTIRKLEFGSAMEVSDIDGDTLTVALVAANGTLSATIGEGVTIPEGANGSSTLALQGEAAELNTALATLQYQGNLDFAGTDTVSYTVSDGQATTAAQSITINVANIQDAPSLDSIADQTTNEETALELTLSASDPDGDDLTFSATGSDNVTANLEGTSLVLVPALDFVGTESISITVEDGNGGTDTGSFNVTVNGVDDPPAIAGINPVAGNEDTPFPLAGPAGGTITTVAGPGQEGPIDGTGADATFEFPLGITLAPDGNFYIAEYQNALIRKMTPQWEVTTFAGDGTGETVSDGTGLSASFGAPWNIVSDSAGNLYVSEPDSSIIRKVTPAAVVTTIAGSPGQSGNADGPGATARFSTPYGLAIDQNSNFLYIADGDSNTIRKIDLNLPETDTGFVTTLAGSPSGQSGSVDGTGAAAQFDFPLDITLDSAGNLYVTDLETPKIRKVTPAGEVSAIAGSTSGDQDGPGASAQFGIPYAITIVEDSYLVVSDGIQKLKKVELSGDFAVTTIAGNGTDSNVDGDFSTATFSETYELLAVGTTVYATNLSNTIRKIELGSGGGLEASDVDGDTLTVNLSVSNGTISLTGNEGISIVEGANGSAALSIQGDAEDVNAALATLQYQGNADFAGNDTLTFNVDDGTNATEPSSLAITVNNVQDAPVLDPIGTLSTDEDNVLNANLSATDPDGDSLVFSVSGGTHILAAVSGTTLTINPVPDFNGSDTITITVDDGQGGTDSETVNITVNPVNDTPILSGVESIMGNEDSALPVIQASEVFTLAGNGTAGEVNGNGLSTQFNTPNGLVVDQDGNAFVVDYLNDLIRKITPTGDVTTFAGNGVPSTGDGNGTAAGFDRPTGITMDAQGNFYVIEGNGTVVRKMTASAEVTTIAGAIYTIGDAVGTAADSRFNFPFDIVWDHNTNSLFISDHGNHRIKKVDLNLPETDPNYVTNFAGSGVAGFADGTGAAAQFHNPLGLDIDSAGNLYVAGGDQNHRIRKITPAGEVTTIAGDGTAGYVDGTGASARFTTPGDVLVYNDNTLFIAEKGGHYIRKVELDNNNTVSTLFGDGTATNADGPFSSATIGLPSALATHHGDLYILSHSGHNVRVASLEHPLYVSDVDGDTLTIHVQAEYGTLSLTLDEGVTVAAGANASPAISIQGKAADLNPVLETLQFTGSQNYVGEAIVSYSVDDGTTATETASVQVSVNNVQDPPVASDSVANGKKNVPVLVNLSGADPDPDSELSFTITSLPESGQLYQTSDGFHPSTLISEPGIDASFLFPEGTIQVSPPINGQSMINLLEGSFSGFEPGVEYTIMSLAGDVTVDIAMWGAGGGNGQYGNGANGGGGGMSEGVVVLEWNQPYTLIVGTGGQAGTVNHGTGGLGGIPGGGFGTVGDAAGAGGGGYTGLFLGSIEHENSIMIAGGGGGATDYSGGGNAGAGGGTNGQDSTAGSKGGTQTAGGTGTSGADGSALQGGNGDQNGNLNTGSADGGGGGGGYYGGEGGFSDARQGAGGSGFIPPELVLGGATHTGNLHTPARSEHLPSEGIAYGATGQNQPGDPGYASITFVTGTSQVGRVIYVPNENFTGSDTFNFEVMDDNEASDSATATVTVTQPAVEFPGSSSAQFTGGSASWLQIEPLPVADDFTLAFWIKTSDPGGTFSTNPEDWNGWWRGHGLVDAEMPGTEYDFGLSILDRGVAFGIGSEGDGFKDIFSKTKVDYGQWFHVAATRNSETGEIQLYIDGVLEANAIATTATLDAAPRLVLGQLQTLVNPYTGEIADLRIYNTVRSEAEIKDDANNVSDTGNPALVGHYTFSEFGAGPAGGGLEPWDLRNHFVAVGFGSDTASANIPLETLDEDIRQVAAGNNFALALLADGSVQAWGDNTHGQTNVPQEALTGVIQVAAGDNVSYALKNDGTVLAWGMDDGNRLDTSTLTNIVKVDAASLSALFLQENGLVHLRTTGDTTVSNVSAWSGGVQDISTSTYGHIALVGGGVQVIGHTNHALTSVPEEALSEVIDVTAIGGTTFFARKMDGTIVAWGKNTEGLTTTLPSLVGGTAQVRYDGGINNDKQLVLSAPGHLVREIITGEGYDASLVDKEGRLQVWGSSANLDAHGLTTVPTSLGASVHQAEKGLAFLVALVPDGDQDLLPDLLETATGTFVSADDTGTSPEVADEDEDGLPDGVEVLHFQGNPFLADTDEDGLDDLLETLLGTALDTPDTDGDTFLDEHEVATGTDPTNPDEFPEASGMSPIALSADTTNDTDGDGLTDGQETHLYSTNPNAADQDNDGLNDAEEVALGTAFDNADTDQDTFEDGHEYSTGTNPLDADEFPVSEGLSNIGIYADTTNDSDGDGLTDAEETHVYHTDPNVADIDEDGLNDSQEVALGTAFNDADSDDDTFLDGHEYTTGTNPLNGEEYPVSEGTSPINVHADTTNDSDNDGLTDGEETHIFQTNLDQADSDQDGIPDGMEISLGTNPNDADSDDDTYSDGHEYSTGTNPLDGEEVPVSEGTSPINVYADTTNDSDQDGLTDAEEEHLFDTNSAQADSDQDGIPDGMEIALGTNPNDTDSDDDTYSDGHEYSTGTNPLDSQEVPESSASSPVDLMADTTDDSDGDGLTDGMETHIHNTNPDLADSDQDGITDDEELALGTNPNDADSDDDGSTDGDEIQYGTAVLDSSNHLLQISGELTYTGNFDGNIFLVIDRDQEGGTALQGLEAAGDFLIPNLQNHYKYKVWAFMDLDGDDEYQVDIEPVGILIAEFTTLEGNLVDQTLLLEDPNNAPTDILLDNDRVEENAPAQTTVGTLTQVDEDEDDSFTFELVEAPEGGTNDNALFSVEGTTLVTTTPLDYETHPSPTIHVKVTDSYGETFTKAFTVQVTNLFTAIITTNEIEDLESGSFAASGSILHNGGGEILSKGVVYGTSPGLSLTSQGAQSNSATGTGNTIDTTLSGLLPDRTYYFRTYAENSEGTAYGRELKFKTPKAGLPDLWAGSTSLGDNWYLKPDFGAFYLQDANWIFHQDLGWLHTVADDDGFWMWNHQLGWTWTRFDIFPYLWKDDSKSWIHFMLSTETDRVFFNATTNQLENYPL